MSEESAKARWQRAYDASSHRDVDFETMSRVPLEAAYGPDEPNQSDEPDVRIGWPGQYPYTRGPHASMYRSKLWTCLLYTSRCV